VRLVARLQEVEVAPQWRQLLHDARAQKLGASDTGGGNQAADLRNARSQPLLDSVANTPRRMMAKSTSK
jgi:hypothetical protein